MKLIHQHMALRNAHKATDDQWLSLIRLVDSEDQWTIIMPEAPGGSIKGINPDGKRFVIVADGRVRGL